MKHAKWWQPFLVASLIGAAGANPTAPAADEASALALDPTLTWTDFLGSAKNDDGYGVAVDAAGNLYLVGTSLATWGNPLRAHSGGPDLVVAKLDSSGNLLWNTFLGSQGADQGYGIALDASGNIAVVGYSDSDWGGPLRAHSGLSDILVAKLTGAGQLVWHSFLGTSEGMSAGSGVAIDSQGNLLVTGKSDADWGDAIRPHAANKQPDIVVAKLGASGTLLWNTFLGSMDNDEGEAIAVDASGNAYVTGASGSPWGNPVRGFAGGKDIVAAKLNPEGRSSGTPSSVPGSGMRAMASRSPAAPYFLPATAARAGVAPSTPTPATPTSWSPGSTSTELWPGTASLAPDKGTGATASPPIARGGCSSPGRATPPGAPIRCFLSPATRTLWRRSWARTV